MRILAIETSCDETAFAVVSITQKDTQRTLLRAKLQKGTAQINRDDLPIVKVEESLVASQIKIHSQFGGVVPTLAKREHLKNLPILWKKIQKNPSVRDKKIDCIAVTVGPGLEPALWTGIEFAKKIYTEYFNSKIPLLGVNHLHGHLYSFLLSQKTEIPNSKFQITNKFKISNSKKEKDTNHLPLDPNHLFPMVSLIVSGGHTIIGVLRSLTEYKKLGETVDDAVGESFDKVARLLDLPYPGGPLIEQLAKKGDKDAIRFPHPMQNQKNYKFSYAGLKTAVLYYLRSQGIVSENFSPTAVAKKALISKQVQKDISASFQEAAFAPLVAKTHRAVEEYGAHSVCVGGGVATNKYLSKLLQKDLENFADVIVPPLVYCQDNAVMIAVAGYVQCTSGNNDYPLVANGTLNV
jgi:N6-L-threonylcarbamoyladenine synthase